MIFVMLGVPYNEVYNDNIFALNEEGKETKLVKFIL